VQSAGSVGLTEDIPENIDVRFRGRGWDLLNILLSKDLTYNIDLTRLRRDTRIITNQLINERLDLPSTVSVLSINPDTIRINFDRVIEKYVKVRSNIVVNTKEEYSIIGEPVFSPDSVLIQGAQSVIRRITSIPTENKIFNNVNSDLSGVLNIKDTLSKLIRITPSQISYHYNVQLSAEKSLDEVEVKILNVPDDKEVLLIPPKINVSVRGGVEQLSDVTPLNINVYINFESIEADTLGFVVPQIEIPRNVIILRVEPDKLQYIIKKKS
jgi:YbbR domain-containing protein